MDSYGPQGWWPVMSHKGKNPAMTGNFRGYHPGDYTYPKNSDQKFEICIGAILTQNTAWKNVEKALLNLKSAKVLSAKKMKDLNPDSLKELIRPAGYFNQKAGYLKNFTGFYLSLKGKIPSRNEILSCKGIGDETADSMLLYAYSQPEFVVDVYTKRIYSNLGFISKSEKYMVVKKMFESAVKKDIVTYQEYHALIVEHAKRYYSKKPYGSNDPLINIL
jgi:endonuclease-3 related protein